ncbi:MAG TPA: 3-isopropylmalate dehydratase small subunit [Kofleriaceae bacterium]|nr:3-isopropylmalate dehydratase small subunit [Kofleriaceae bacterium]
MSAFNSLLARAVLLSADDVDTDQIIPARFLKATQKTGLGEHLFADWRTRPGFPLTASGAAGAQILVTGTNFGCGSSREHAPWSLVDWGFRAIIARSFADIFKQNATKNGLLPIALPDRECVWIEQLVKEKPSTQIHVDLAAECVTLPDGSTFSFVIEPFAKHCLLNGIDELGYILSFYQRITAYEQR